MKINDSYVILAIFNKCNINLESRNRISYHDNVFTKINVFNNLRAHLQCVMRDYLRHREACGVEFNQWNIASTEGAKADRRD